MQRRMMRRVWPALLGLGIASLAMGAVRSAHGPDPSQTAAPAFGTKPAEPTCTVCHDNNTGNNLNTPGGAVEILDLPDYYLPGQLYTLRVRLHSDSTLADPGRLWGFQLTAVRALDGQGAGSFELPAPDTLQVVLGDYLPWQSRSYVEHTSLGTRDGLGGPVEWTFSWRAPDPHQGTIFFYCAGNAADGAGGDKGDFVFTAADTVRADPTPVAGASWGSLKARYR